MKKTMWIASIMVPLCAIALVVGGQGFGTEMAFAGALTKPDLPAGAHLYGPSAKGTLTITVNGAQTTASFEGRCGDTPINTGSHDISNFADEAFLTQPTTTEKDIANVTEAVFMILGSSPIVAVVLNSCFLSSNTQRLGIYTTAINRTLSKTNPTATSMTWIGDATIQGVRRGQ